MCISRRKEHWIKYEEDLKRADEIICVNSPIGVFDVNPISTFTRHRSSMRTHPQIITSFR